MNEKKHRKLTGKAENLALAKFNEIKGSSVKNKIITIVHGVF